MPLPRLSRFGHGEQGGISQQLAAFWYQLENPNMPKFIDKLSGNLDLLLHHGCIGNQPFRRCGEEIHAPALVEFGPMF